MRECLLGDEFRSLGPDRRARCDDCGVPVNKADRSFEGLGRHLRGSNRSRLPAEATILK